MKTLFICSERKINDHVGEYYDDIIEVEHQPVAGKIEKVAKAVLESVRQLWKKDLEDKDREGEPCVQAYLDAASPFNAMLIDYRVVLGDEGIKLELPYLESDERTTEDKEAKELIKKLEERGGKHAKV